MWALSNKIHKVYPALKRYTNLKLLQYFARQRSASIHSEAKEFFEEFIKDPLVLDANFSKAMRIACEKGVT